MILFEIEALQKSNEINYIQRLTSLLCFYSYEDGINESLDNNFTVMFGGFSLIFFYICITLGRWNMLEQRVIINLFIYILNFLPWLL
jgi:hypothetical protein